MTEAEQLTGRGAPATGRAAPATGAHADGDLADGPPLVYLDHAASAPSRPEVAEAVAPFLGPLFGNPSGSHRVARRARRAVEDAREEVAELLGVSAAEVVFTSGGTESDNLAVLGALGALDALARGRSGRGRPLAIVCSAIEHPAVLQAAQAASLRGIAELRLAPVTPAGLVDLPALEELLDPDVAVVSVMTANNETGVVQPIGDVARLVRRCAPGAILHTDAVQAAPWLDLRPVSGRVDLLSVSAHKCGGPHGAGVLVVRAGVELAPLVHGGGQQRGRRSGTENVAGAVGTAVALRSAVAGRAPVAGRPAEVDRVRTLRDRLVEGLLDEVPGAAECAPREKVPVLPGHALVRFEGVEQEELLVLLDRDGLCASGGSACASGALEPSPVLVAMGLSPQQARGALRTTLGFGSTTADVDRALEVVPRAVDRLRSSA